MHHPFELELSELKTLNLEIPEITDEEAEKVAGGKDKLTTQATHEGDNNPTTQATHEMG